MSSLETIFVFPSYQTFDERECCVGEGEQLDKILIVLTRLPTTNMIVALTTA